MASDYYVDVTQGGPYTFFNPAAAAAAPCVANPTIAWPIAGGIGGYVPPWNPPGAGAPWPGGWPGGLSWSGYASEDRVQALEMRTAALEARLLRLERQVRRRLVRKGKRADGHSRAAAD